MRDQLKTHLHFKSIVCLLIVVFLSLKVSADDSQPMCGSEKNCGELSSELGYAFLALGALVGPHFIKNDYLLNRQNKTLISIGNNNFKALDFDLNSELISEFPLSLNTTLDLQIYNKTTPSVLRYRIGSGYKVLLREYLHLNSVVKMTAEKLESMDKVRIAPELKFTVTYSATEKTALEAGGEAIFFEDMSWKIFTGIGHRLEKNQTSMFSDLDLFFSIGYEENHSIQEKIYFASLGFVF